MIGFKGKIYFLIIIVSLITASKYTSHPNLAPLAENSAQPSVVMEDNSSVPTTELPPPILISPDPVPARPETTSVSRGSVPRLLNEEIIWHFLLANGFTEVQTAGIMGNLQQEHNFLTSDTSNGLGIAQWTGSRRAKLMKWQNYLSLQTQLNFMMYELKGSYTGAYERLKQADTITNACLIFQNEYEAPGKPMQSQRIQYAHEIYKKYATNQ